MFHIQSIPDYMPKVSFIDQFKLREEYIKERGFSFVSWKWINPLVNWIGNKKCLEVMAGKGTLSYALRQKGVNIITTDDFSWAKSGYHEWNETLTEVVNMDAVDAVDKFGKDIDVLIMSWPYMDDTAFRVIKRLHEVNPSALIIYIGESMGGCTANEDFFYHFERIDDELFDEVTSNYERWQGLHDYPMLGKYVLET
jgi:hypothetical protein